MRDHLVGRVLDGRYEIVQRLARGGMATVYLATDRRLTRTVAVKVMHEGLGDDQEFTRKFDREARAAARLSHPNIVSVFDQGLDAGRPYIVMEYVEGRTLRNVITTEAPLDPIRALDLIEPVVAAVAAAHEAGLIHRDIKPENVLISDRGRVKVVDFGLAKAITAQTATATEGLLLGTVSYIAPELVTEGRPRPWSDVYSIGVVLFEMLTGRKPHTGENPIQVAYSHVHKSVPEPSSMLSSNWLASRSAIPPYLDALVTSTTAREGTDRPQDARVLLSHVKAARRALGAGIMNDPALTDRMRLRTIGEIAEAATTPSSAQSPPTQRMARVEVTPGSPASPATLSPVAMASAARLHSASRSDEDEATAPDGVPVARTSSAGRRAPRPLSRQAVYRRRRLMTLIALVTVLALIGGTVAWWALDYRWTTSPSLVNNTEEEARTAALDAHVSLTFTEAYSETVQAGRVISTDPAAGERMLRDGQVTAVVSKGPERYTVPPLAGKTQQDASRALTDANLAVGQVSEVWDESVAIGLVVGASQRAGTPLKPGTAVDLTVSKGPQPISIVDYTGKPLESSKLALEKAGFTVKVTGEENSATVPKGSIVSQTPSSGNGKKGDTINLVSSLGPVMVTVPSVRAMSLDKAKVALTNAGLKVKVNYLIASPLGMVVSSDPAAGTQAAQGSTVTLNVA
jgi:serine/threonine-protein kinase